MKIKVVCERTGLTDRTIRYYIEEELLSPSFKENYIGRKSFDFTEDDIARLNDIAVLRNFDFSIEEIRQILKDPSSSPSIIKAVKHRVSGELTTNQKKESLLSSLPEQTAYTVCDLAKQLSSAAEITGGEKKSKSKRMPRMTIVSAAVSLLFIGVFFFIFAFCNKTCEHRDADDNGLCDACEEAFTDAVEHAIGFKTLGVSGTVASIKVSNGTTRFSFLDEVSVSGNATFEVFYDVECKDPIENKTLQLAIGDNVFYVLEYVGGERRNLYTVTVRRKPMYAVSFDTAGGTAIAPQMVEEGAFIAVPDSPSKSGYFFAGWSRNLTLPVTGDITVKANWTNKSCTVTYNANGGMVDATTVSIAYDQVYMLKVPERLGYSFEGWFCGEDKIELTGVWEIVEDVTLTASWRPHTNIPYKVEHYVEKLDGTYGLRATDNYTGASDAIVTPMTKNYEGFTAPKRQTVTVLPDGTRVVRYDYTRNSYTVTFVTNGGKEMETQTLKHGLQLPRPIRRGYTFGGWFSDAYLKQAITSVPVKDIMIYAWWTEENKPRDFLYSGKDEITITDFNVTASSVNIPTFIGGRPVTGIDDSAFWHSGSLESITFPVSMTNISNSAFQYCSSIASITVKEGNAVYHSKGNCLIETATNTLVLGAINSIIPDYVTSIGDCAFSGRYYITSITLPTGLTDIGDYAFYNCGRLTSITIPTGVTVIGDAAFFGCSSLKLITLPVGLTSIGNYLFHACNNLTSVTISSGVTSIGDYAFYDCSSLTSVTLPNGLTSIGYAAFYNCSSLKSITLPTGTHHIGNDVFSQCSSLKSITLPDSLTSIGPGAFSGCVSLTSITIPRGVRYIQAYTFECCYALASITLSSNIFRIGNHAFSQCSSLKSITLPDSLTSIGDSVFSRCSSLISITIPTGVTDIGQYAFYDCRGLTSVTLPATLTSIGYRAFMGCSNLTSVIAPIGYLPQCFECFSSVPKLYFCCLYEYDGTGKPAGLSDFEKTQQFGGWYADAELTTPFDFDAWLAGERVIGDTLTLYTKFSAS